MEESKKKFIETVKQANNILVTVRSNPSIDHLAACIALSLMLNEMGKHATAVFSGSIPAVMDFLEPEKTLKTDTDSLQDFIISLDKVKADKLRYKVEDDVVKIFITPYKTSITSKDLEFSQGDFNVDVIVALGVHSQDDLDKAVTSHGRILHDATIVSLNVTAGDGGKDELGSINWVDTTVSSLSEMLATSIEGLEEGEGSDKQKPLLDNQVATALLTGIVAETDRFGNSKTTPATMQISATLLIAGANQELVATKLSSTSPPAGTGSISLEVADEGDIVDYGGNDGTGGFESGHKSDHQSDSRIGSSEKPADETGSKPSHRRSKSKAGKNGNQKPDDQDQAGQDQDSSVGPTDNYDEPAEADRPEPIIDESVAIEHEPEHSLVTAVRSDNGSGHEEPALSSLDLAGGVSAVDPEGMVTGDGVVAPQVYDLNQISVPASLPTNPMGTVPAGPVALEAAVSPLGNIQDQNVWPAVQAAYEEAASVPVVVATSQESAEDQAVLSVLSHSKPINTERTVIQPLRDQNGFVAQPPLYDKKSGLANGGHESVDTSLDPIKFAVTPPSLGGTLTASHDLADEAPSPDPMTNDHVRTRSIMTHDPQTFPSGIEAAQGLEAGAGGEPRGVGELDPNAEPLEHNGLPQFGLIHDGKPSDTAEAKAALPPTKKHVVSPLSAAGVASQNAVPVSAVGTLAELESQLDSPHLAANVQSTFSPLPQAGPVQADTVDQALQAVLAATPVSDVPRGPNAGVTGLPTFDMPMPPPAGFGIQAPPQAMSLTTAMVAPVIPAMAPAPPVAPPMMPMASLPGR